MKRDEPNTNFDISLKTKVRTSQYYFANNS